MLILGIDPGSVSGAYALLNTDPKPGECPIVADLPVVDRMVNGAEFARILRQAKPDVAIIEQVSAAPKQGVTSSFRFGKGAGIIEGIVLGMGIRLHTVAPSKWKPALRLTTDKEKSRALAIRMFPQVEGLHLKKHHGRAEALLLAHYLQTRPL